MLPGGEQLSELAINPGGARFELWTVQSDPYLVYLLDTRYVGAYVPVADVVILTEDPYTYTGVPRTRADRPFVVEMSTSGLLSGATDPLASKSVNLLRHVQSYGVGGDGTSIDRNQAILIHQVSLTENANYRMTYTVTSIPGADRSKVAGEERFSIWSLADVRDNGTTTYTVPSSQLASKYVQIWPVADGNISGIAQNQAFRFKLPQITLTLNDLYPDSRTYAQVYKGNLQDGVEGTVVSGSLLAIYGATPVSRVLSIDDWDAAIAEDGRWTMEILTATPFGIDRLAWVSFDVDRTINVNASITTID